MFLRVYSGFLTSQSSNNARYSSAAAADTYEILGQAVCILLYYTLSLSSGDLTSDPTLDLLDNVEKLIVN
jgi:hypothetical protein